MKSFKRQIYKFPYAEEDTKVIPCQGSLHTKGEIGTYEVQINIGTELGYTGIQYDSFAIPDRFQIIYDGNIVADSKFVGSTSYFDDLLGTYTQTIYEYDNGDFVDTGNTEQITVTNSDIADGSPSEPTSGQGIIEFNRQDTNSDIITIRVTGVLGGTLWNIQSYCPQEEPIIYEEALSLVYGTSISTVDCSKVTGEGYYFIDSSIIGIGTKIYTDYQRINKADAGYYVYLSTIYQFDGNKIVEEYDCSIQGII